MELKYAMVFALLLAVPMAYADSGNLSSQMLSNAMAHVQCKTTFMTGLVSLIQANSQGAGSLSTSALQADEQTLQTDANNGDVSAFKTDVATFDSDLKSLNSEIVSWRQADGKNLTSTERQAIKSGDQQLRTTLESCSYSALQNYANEKVSWYASDLSKAQDQVSNLSAKGIDTSGLSAAITEAQSTIVTPLQTAIAAATDSKSLEAALDQYCLYDGCKSGTNDHFAAKWDIAKTSAIESYLQSQPNAGNFTSQFTQVTNDVSQSQSALSSVGTNAYAPGQSDSVFNPLKDAANVLKQIVHGMRS